MGSREHVRMESKNGKNSNSLAREQLGIGVSRGSFVGIKCEPLCMILNENI